MMEEKTLVREKKKTKNKTRSKTFFLYLLIVSVSVIAKETCPGLFFLDSTNKTLIWTLGVTAFSKFEQR
jgi:hypothetical protein